MKDTITLLVAAGGTGGHLFPALAVAQKVEELSEKKVKLIFTGRADKIESRVIPSLGYQFESMDIYGITKLLSIKTLLLPLSIRKSTVQMKALIEKEDIDAVLCAGAYISYPPGMAAYKTKTPLFIMEANVNPGKSIRLLSKKADRIFTSFKESAEYFPAEDLSKIVYSGNPVRKNILDLPEKEKAILYFDLDPRKKTILVFGGSLGARSINLGMEKYIKQFADKDYQIIWQTGKNYTYKGDAYDNLKVVEFIEDMNLAYAASDLVISRSGGTTVAELAVIGKPSILVPLPSASNNEQEYNAQALLNKNAAILLADKDVSDLLYELADGLINDSQKLESMGRDAKLTGMPNASDICAKEILSFF